jgi:hypothetical protein
LFAVCIIHKVCRRHPCASCSAQCKNFHLRRRRKVWSR